MVAQNNGLRLSFFASACRTSWASATWSWNHLQTTLLLLSCRRFFALKRRQMVICFVVFYLAKSVLTTTHDKEALKAEQTGHFWNRIIKTGWEVEEQQRMDPIFAHYSFRTPMTLHDLDKDCTRLTYGQRHEDGNLWAARNLAFWEMTRRKFRLHRFPATGRMFLSWLDRKLMLRLGSNSFTMGRASDQAFSPAFLDLSKLSRMSVWAFTILCSTLMM